MIKKLLLTAALVVLPLSAVHASDDMDSIDGKKIFQNNCAKCHAMDGTVSDYGKTLQPFPARNLRALAPYADKDEIRRVITHGTHDSDMRAMKYVLDGLEIEAVVDYISTFTYTPDLQNGATRFQQVCATCHGADGRAKTGVGAKNLVYSQLTLNEKVHTIRYGRPGTLMLAKHHQLNNTDIADIANYVQGLRRSGVATIGHNLYDNNCKSCHTTPASIKLVGNAATAKVITDLSDYMIDLRIRHGRHVRRAGEHIVKLTDDNIQDIIAYMRAEQ